MACPILMAEAGRGAMALEANEDGVHEALDVQRGMKWGTVAGWANRVQTEKRGVCLETLAHTRWGTILTAAAAAVAAAATITSTHGCGLQVRVKRTGGLRATAAYVYKAPPSELPLSLSLSLSLPLPLPLHPPQLFLIYLHCHTFFFDTSSHSYCFYRSLPGSAASTIAPATLVARRQRPARPALQLTADALPLALTPLLRQRKLVTVAVFTTCKLSSTNATALPSPGLAYSFKPRQAQVSAPTLYSEQRLRQHATVHTHSTLRSPQQALSYYNFRRLSTMPAPTAPSPVRLPRSFLTIH
ncbi:hypothetical protein PMIN01_01113 [Paraphaeosphaeria minitans]|uniref:Uncharacterized protein n=1 Tax=Paraphaeosphaeria minitans TaxID=565426 RepID=A0A9P6GWP7_9PLEO|nr:hypothetical protein PMIN01_01113 [Paraphaeosphaeria minitans]